MKTKRGTPPPMPYAVNPYMVARKSAMQLAKVTAAAIHAKLAAGGIWLSTATVREVINGKFRNANVIHVFCEMTGTVEAVVFPAAELEWLERRKNAERVSERSYSDIVRDGMDE